MKYLSLAPKDNAVILTTSRLIDSKNPYME